MIDVRKPSKHEGKLLVLTPGMGAVATTFIAGVESVRRGPTSMNSRLSSVSNVETADAKRTVLRRCAAQYAGSVACCGVSQSPVAVETIGIDGALRRMPRTSRSNGSTTASIVGE